MSTSLIVRVDQKINAIRNAARARLGAGPMDTCPTCTRCAPSPFRQIVDGKIVEGCVDAFHGPALTPTTSSFAWHMRPQAIQTRRDTLRLLQAIQD